MKWNNNTANKAGLIRCVLWIILFRCLQIPNLNYRIAKDNYSQTYLYRVKNSDFRVNFE